MRLQISTKTNYKKEKIMKRLISIILFIALALTLAACGETTYEPIGAPVSPGTTATVTAPPLTGDVCYICKKVADICPECEFCIDCDTFDRCSYCNYGEDCCLCEGICAICRKKGVDVCPDCKFCVDCDTFDRCPHCNYGKDCCICENKEMNIESNSGVPVEISNIHSAPGRWDNSLFVSGTVTNTGNRPLHFIRLVVYILDEQGRNIGSTSLFAVGSSPWLMPGESAMWDRNVDINENMTSFTVELDRFSYAD
jgi:predicted small secreted protein